MSLGSQKQTYRLHIWPKTDSSLSLDPSCVAALLFLQIYVPGQFEVEYSANPDLSPTGELIIDNLGSMWLCGLFTWFTGQLPYLTHGMHSVAGYHAIVKYISSGILHDETLKKLSSVQKAQSAARMAHIEASLGDLVVRIFL
jgi:sorting and assembly machinery component 37